MSRKRTFSIKTFFRGGKNVSKAHFSPKNVHGHAAKSDTLNTLTQKRSFGEGRMSRKRILAPKRTFGEGRMPRKRILAPKRSFGEGRMSRKRTFSSKPYFRGEKNVLKAHFSHKTFFREGKTRGERGITLFLKSISEV